MSRTTHRRTYPGRNGGASVYLNTGVSPKEREEYRRLAAERGTTMAALLRDHVRRDLYLAQRGRVAA